MSAITASAAPPLLALHGLTLRFGGLTAVDRVDLQVQAGEILALIGPNGAGKTSVFNAITGQHPPSAGAVLWEGRRIRNPARPWAWAAAGCLGAAGCALALNLNALWESAINALAHRSPFPWGEAAAIVARHAGQSPWIWLPAIVGALVAAGGAWNTWRLDRSAPDVVARAGLARTFQNIRLFRDLSVLDNVLIGRDRHLRSRAWEALLGLPRPRREDAAARRAALDELRFVGLEAHAQASAGSLPYGHQRRLEIARALATGPRLLLLDEPAAGMNPTEAEQLVQLIRRIRDRGITVLLIEHHMRVVMGISDRICVLHQGRVLAQGSPAAIAADPAVIEAYLGREPAA